MKMKILPTVMALTLASFISLPVMAKENHEHIEADDVAAEAATATQGQMQNMNNGGMGKMQMMQSGGMGKMSPEMKAQKMQMMKEKQEMMKKHMAVMEQRLANIEALLKELVELEKKK